MEGTKPTQVKRPWRATVRTAFAVIVALAAMLPLLVSTTGIDETLPPVAGALAIASAITRLMALPQVDKFLAQFLPFLAADPDAADGLNEREPVADDPEDPGNPMDLRFDGEVDGDAL